MIRAFSFSTEGIYRGKQQRQAEAAKLSGIEITQYTEADLPKHLLDYAKDNPRGFGFWRWKPYLTMLHAAKCDVGDIVLYVDSGDKIEASFWPFLNAYFENNDLLLVNRGYSHREWTKPECLAMFGNTDDCLQLEAGLFAFKIHPYSPTMHGNYHLFYLWNEYSEELPYLFNDESIARKSYIDHRHDQSVLTCLAQRSNHANQSINLNYIIKWNQQI